jgi:hypothetical protein
MQSFRLPFICALLLFSASSSAQAADKSETTTKAKPKYHINYKPVDAPSKNKPFQTLQASLPDRAVKVYLHRIKAEPNTYAGLMSNAGIDSTAGTTNGTANGAGTGGNNGATNVGNSSTAFDTGTAPRIMTPSGTAIPQTMGSSYGFFK